MKLTILTNVVLKEKELQETRELGLEIEVRKTRAKIRTKYNEYFKAVWGDFEWLRNQFTEPTDIRAFVTSKKQLVEKGIAKHIGMYDLVDNDATYDFYIGLPTRLSSKAKANGFKCNLAWLICHEVCHGLESSTRGLDDRTHDMQKEGRLKELWQEHMNKQSGLQKFISDFKALISSLIK